MDLLFLKQGRSAIPSMATDLIAPGTPFERPKIANTIVELIGATPMVLLAVFNVIFVHVIVGSAKSSCKQRVNRKYFSKT